MPVNPKNKSRHPAAAKSALTASHKRQHEEMESLSSPQSDDAKSASMLPLASKLNPITLGDIQATEKAGVLQMNRPGKAGLFFKPQQNSVLAQLESYNAAVFRVLAGSDRAPSMKPYHGSANEVRGVMSKEISGFVPNNRRPLDLLDLKIQGAAGSDLARCENNRWMQRGRVEDLRHTAEYILSDADRDNYERIRGLAASLMANYLFKNSDCNNANLAKDGKQVDFGRLHAPIVGEIDSSRSKSSFLAGIKDSMLKFQCTARDISSFPVLQDARMFYWPTNSPRDWMMWALDNVISSMDGEHSAQMLEAVLAEPLRYYLESLGLAAYPMQLILACSTPYHTPYEFYQNLAARLQHKDNRNTLLRGIMDELDKLLEVVFRDKSLLGNMAGIATSGNAYSDGDNGMYRLLQTHPVFVFHKYKSLLKFILLDEEIFRALAELHISPLAKTEGGNMALRDVIVAEDMARLREVKAVLLSMPEFKQFLSDEKDTSFAIIRYEMEELRLEFEKKLGKKPYHAAVVKALDEDKLNDRFKSLLAECGLASRRTLRSRA